MALELEMVEFDFSAEENQKSMEFCIAQSADRYHLMRAFLRSEGFLEAAREQYTKRNQLPVSINGHLASSSAVHSPFLIDRAPPGHDILYAEHMVLLQHLLIPS